LRNAGPTKGKMRWSRLSLLLRRLPELVVDPRLTEILIEVAGIAVGAGEASPLRVGIRAGARACPLHGGACVAAAFASGRLGLGAPASLRLPPAVAGIGVGLCFCGGLCSLPGPGTRLAVVVLRPGPGRGLAGLVVLVPRPGPGRGLVRLDGIDPTHPFGWAPAGVDGYGVWAPDEQGDGEKECFGGTGTCCCSGEGHCGKHEGGSAGRTHGNLHWGMDGFTSPSELCPIMAWIDVMAITQWSISCQKVRTIIVADQLHC